MVFANLVKTDDMEERRQDTSGDPSSIADELRPLVDMYDLTVDDEKIIIPQNPDYGVLYNDGVIRFDDIAEITTSRAFVNVLIRDGYLFTFYRHSPLISCTRHASL